MKKILVLNGSLSGKEGNTEAVIEKLSNVAKKFPVEIEIVQLNSDIPFSNLEIRLKEAHAFIFTSGTYWDSWGSPLQKFLEEATALEASDAFLGKPAGVIITMHSVGGKGVLSRLQGVLNTQGMLIPPMSGMVYSLAGHLALQTESSFADDFWSLDDVETIVHNINTVLNGKQDYKTWPVDHKDPKRIWIK